MYGSGEDIEERSYGVAYSLGPVVTGQMVHELGCVKVNLGMRRANGMYATAFLMLKNVSQMKRNYAERDNLLEDGPTGLYDTIKMEDRNRKRKGLSTAVDENGIETFAHRPYSEEESSGGEYA